VNVLLCGRGTGRPDLYGWGKKFETLYISSQFEIIFEKQDSAADNLLPTYFNHIKKCQEKVKRGILK
jgi:hypothetical protein